MHGNRLRSTSAESGTRPRIGTVPGLGPTPSKTTARDGEKSAARDVCDARRSGPGPAPGPVARPFPVESVQPLLFAAVRLYVLRRIDTRRAPRVRPAQSVAGDRPDSSWILIGLVRIYQWTLSPIMGRDCRFQPTCSHYFIGAVNKYGAVRGAPQGDLEDLPVSSLGRERVGPALTRRRSPRSLIPRRRSAPMGHSAAAVNTFSVRRAAGSITHRGLCDGFHRRDRESLGQLPAPAGGAEYRRAESACSVPPR